MIIRSWLESDSVITHGNLVEWVMLTRAHAGDPGKPGRVLSHLVSISRAILDPECSSFPTCHTSLQEVFYVVKGKGRITVEEEQHPVRDGDTILIPSTSCHTLTNSEEEPMELLVVLGDVPSEKMGTAAEKLVIRNWRQAPVSKGHWNHLVRQLLTASDGLANISQIILVDIEGMRVCEPHSHPPKGDELWYLLEGEVLHWVGQEFRVQRPGSVVPAYPSDLTHTQINATDKLAKFFYVARYGTEP
jgi:quercetin dioxygenase-like cupin family protein